VRSWNGNQPIEEKVFSPHAHATAHASVTNSQQRADKSRRRYAKIAEPLLAGMPNSGEFRFSAKQFEALAEYCLLESLPEVKAAIKRDTFKMGNLTFIADRTLSDGPTMTIAEFARAAKVPKETVRRRVVGQISLRFLKKGEQSAFMSAT